MSCRFSTCLQLCQGKGGRVQLEQSNMRLALNMAKMDNEGFSHAAMEETKYLIKKPLAEVQEKKKRGVEFPGRQKVKDAIQRHLAMLHQNQTSSCLPCQNRTGKSPQPRWRCKGTGAPPPDQRRERPPELTPPLPGTPPAPTGNTSRVPPSENVNLPAGYTHSKSALPCTESFNDEDTEHDTDFDPEMLTDER